MILIQVVKLFVTWQCVEPSESNPHHLIFFILFTYGAILLLTILGYHGCAYYLFYTGLFIASFSKLEDGGDIILRNVF